MSAKVVEFLTKSGKQALIRAVTPSDTASMMTYINELSSEDTYITFSGEQLSFEEEEKYLLSCEKETEAGNMIKLACEVAGQIVGVCDIRRELTRKKRGYHIGIVGLTVNKHFRGDGIGKMLLQQTMSQAQEAIPGLRILLLYCFETNIPALRLYTKLGFQETGRIPQGTLYKGEYIDEIQMCLQLT